MINDRQERKRVLPSGNIPEKRLPFRVDIKCREGKVKK